MKRNYRGEKYYQIRWSVCFDCRCRDFDKPTVIVKKFRLCGEKIQRRRPPLPLRLTLWSNAFKDLLGKGMLEDKVLPVSYRQTINWDRLHFKRGGLVSFSNQLATAR